eukprot:9443084-Lingulodinium_polyedra.AAC.1
MSCALPRQSRLWNSENGHLNVPRQPRRYCKGRAYVAMFSSTDDLHPDRRFSTSECCSHRMIIARPNIAVHDVSICCSGVWRRGCGRRA